MIVHFLGMKQPIGNVKCAENVDPIISEYAINSGTKNTENEINDNNDTNEDTSSEIRKTPNEYVRKSKNEKKTSK